MTAPRSLCIIEPNLTGNSGHYAEFIRGLAHRCAGTFDELDVHGGAGARTIGMLHHPAIRITESFAGRRRVAEFRALRGAMLDASRPCLVLTAKSRHALQLQAAALMGARSAGHMCLMHHWRESSLPQRLLCWLSPTVRATALALAPTASTAGFLRTVGWRRVVEIAYPTATESELPELPVRPERLLVAGALRLNKGIALIADLADRLAGRGGNIPMVIQTTGKRAGRHGGAEGPYLDRLQANPWPGLILDPVAPDRVEYLRRFHGSLVLTPYDPIQFADNVSGIALDAVLHGSPIVATAGSWPAGLIERFGCGVVMPRWTSEALDQAVRQAMEGWSDIVSRARSAAIVLRRDHDPAHLARVIASFASSAGSPSATP